MSKKSSKRGSGAGSKSPAVPEGIAQEVRTSKVTSPAWTPRPQQAARPESPAPAPSAAPPAAAAAARTVKPSHEEISRLAHDLWAQRGRPQGQDIDIWCEAERRLTRKA